MIYFPFYAILFMDSYSPPPPSPPGLYSSKSDKVHFLSCLLTNRILRLTNLTPVNPYFVLFWLYTLLTCVFKEAPILPKRASKKKKKTKISPGNVTHVHGSHSLSQCPARFIKLRSIGLMWLNLWLPPSALWNNEKLQFPASAWAFPSLPLSFFSVSCPFDLWELIFKSY